jgi:hypothetical protein
MKHTFTMAHSGDLCSKLWHDLQLVEAVDGHHAREADTVCVLHMLVYIHMA